MLQRLPRRQKNVSVFDFSIQDACCRITSLIQCKWLQPKMQVKRYVTMITLCIMRLFQSLCESVLVFHFLFMRRNAYDTNG